MAKPRPKGYRKEEGPKAPTPKPKPELALTPADMARDPWPVPRDCAYAWATGGSISLGFPPSPSHSHGHSVRLPEAETLEAKAACWDLLLKVLRQRRGDATIATPGAPDQRLLDAYAEALARGSKAQQVPLGTAAQVTARAEREAAAAAKLAATLGACGIPDLSDLDLDL